MIKEEDLLPKTTAKYGIEFESIIMDKENHDYICITDNKLYYSEKRKEVSKDLRYLLIDFNAKAIFDYHPSLECRKPNGEYKRLEFASKAFSPSTMKPSTLFENLKLLIEAFHDWTNEKYYLPDHGTINIYNKHMNQFFTTLTGGTHITISFPLTKTDNPITWKYFMWLFTGLLTMYQPIYIALNGAPSPHTKGSERQRTSASVVVGSAYIYDIFTPESERYEIFINSPSIDYEFPDYPSYAHWNDKTLKYKEDGPWRGAYKSDIGSSEYHRSDVFRLHNDYRTLIYDIKSKYKLINKPFYDSYEYFSRSLLSMTSNLIEFRFFDNEPIDHLLNKFNLLIRIADYAYEQAKNMEDSIGIESLKDHLPHQIDDRLNIRPLVNKKPWHDAVLESMNEGLDAKFNEEFIDECYEFLQLTQFSNFLENPEMKEISAIDLNEVFIKEMNKAEHHFSEYFQTDNPTSEYSKEYQIEKLNESKLIAEEKMKFYVEEKARKEEAERQRIARIELEQCYQIGIIINENIRTQPEGFNDFLIEHINKLKLTELLREKIYVDNDTLTELIKYGSEEMTEDSLLNPTDKDNESLLESLNEWISGSLLPYLREKEPTLKAREDAEDRNREREREQQL